MKKHFSLLLAGLFAFGCAVSIQAAEVQVAVAANFTVPMKLIAADFEKTTGHHAALSFGATGKLHAQITNGAPFDVFLTADDTTLAGLEQEHAVVPGTRFVYAIGKLVLWSASPGLVNGNGEVLKKNEFTHLALANPKLAPYGAAAIETLTHLGLLTALQPKLVQGESIGQVFSFVASGSAELGFVALSQIHEDGRIKGGSVWMVPAGLYKPIRQEAAVLMRAKDNKAAAALIEFLKTERAKAVIRSFGYDL
jgi:molybdate transport system substrate-binding protein